MVETPDIDRTSQSPPTLGDATAMSDVETWFIREVLPLEAALMHYLRRSWRDKAAIDDLCQDVYVRVYEAAAEQIPNPARPFVFTIARNLMIDRARREQVVSFEAITDLDALGMAIDEPGPDRTLMAREDLRRLQAALDTLPPRCREAVILKKIENLSRREIAQRMGIGEESVKQHIANGMHVLANHIYGDAGEGTPHD